MSNDETPPSRPFVARIFESPAIKAWKDPEGKTLRHALATAVEGLRAGRALVLDVLVDFEAEQLEPLMNASTVLYWRSRPSNEFGPRVRRLLGFYSGESTLAAALVIENVEHLVSLLRGDVLWDAEFTIYPQPDEPLGELPDPHNDASGFASHVSWALMQHSTSETWMVTARRPEGLDTVCAALTSAFTKASLTSTTSDAPNF